MIMAKLLILSLITNIYVISNDDLSEFQFPKQVQIIKPKSDTEIAEYYNGLTYKPEMVVEDKSGTIVLRSSNIQDSKLDFNDIVRVNIQAKEKNIVRKNDILMCSRNGSAKLVGKTAIINKTEKMYFGAFMMLISDCTWFTKILFD